MAVIPAGADPGPARRAMDKVSVRWTRSRHRSVSRYRQATSPDVVIFCCRSASLSALASRVAASACSRSSSCRARTVAWMTSPVRPKSTVPSTNAVTLMPSASRASPIATANRSSVACLAEPNRLSTPNSGSPRVFITARLLSSRTMPKMPFGPNLSWTVRRRSGFS